MPGRKNAAAKSANKGKGAATSATASGGQSRAGQSKEQKNARKAGSAEEREYLKQRRAEARAEAASHLKHEVEGGEDTTDVHGVSWSGPRKKPDAGEGEQDAEDAQYDVAPHAGEVIGSSGGTPPLGATGVGGGDTVRTTTGG